MVNRVLLAVLLVFSQEGTREDLNKLYTKWLQEDVVYIITEPERAVFLSLQTSEEKDHFIEQFWMRRDPTPGNAQNEYKEEHYRRIQYANERFTAGRPGWRTDRGRIYIKFGEPDGMERRPTGGQYTRPASEGGGLTTANPFEIWRYRYVEGIGPDVEIEFVDQYRTGDYRILTHPNQKDALLYVPSVGLTEYEEMGLETRADRLTREGLATTYPGPLKDQPFERLARLATLTRPPAFKFEELRSLVDSRVTFQQLPMRVATHHLRVGADSALVSIAVEVPNSELKYERLESVYRAEVQIYGRISDISGRVVSEFEDTVHAEHTEGNKEQALSRSSLYQKLMTMKGGTYKLELVLRDPASKTIGTAQERIAVPATPPQGLACSPVILASRIEGATSGSSERFVLGNLKVVPNLSRNFPRGDLVGVYLHVYGASMDASTARPSVTVRYHLLQSNRSVRPPLIDEQGSSVRFFSEQRVVLVSGVLTDGLKPGSYRLLIRVKDNITDQETTADATFQVIED